MAKKYKDVNSNPSFPEMELKNLARWKKHQTFERSVRGEDEFVFYDGPPFANGLPHYGHLLTGYVKDLIARYQTMLGKKVERRFGWDCHGLPAEMGLEKALGISGRKGIVEYGVDKFNQQCRELAIECTGSWEYYIDRQARWVNLENAYKTMDIPYMESVIWGFKKLYDKGLIYQSVRVLPYSWKCQTPVSDFETRIDNSFREKASKSVTAAIKLEGDPLNLGMPTFLLIWTTTPWTLPSNLAVALNAEIDYAIIKCQNRAYVVALELAVNLAKEIGNEVIMVMKGEDLVGLRYEPLFPYFKNHKNAFQTLAGDFVTTETGTGIVHIAPGFGEDDYNLCALHDIQYVCPIDDGGCFNEQVWDYIGMQVFDTNDSIIMRLKENANWVKTEQYLHNYPHCWRTDTPLIYRAMPSWYLKVTNIKEKMIENNQQINWIPEHIRDGLFGKWLVNARDWSISRQRFWGCPIPVWISDNPKYPRIEVYGSIKELQDAFRVQVTDLHRPFIDTLVRPNPDDPTGQSKMIRVQDVLDCWFESGSMPFAQLHYPFENQVQFESHASADFIVEYVAQTRGWFYTLLVLSTALFDRPPFYNCICHGVILGKDGQKLSKRLQNYPDPIKIFDLYGADALRWYLISSPVMRGQEIYMDKEGDAIQEVVRLVLKPIWNAYNFFIIYANADGIGGKYDTSSQYILDRYILTKCSLTISTIRKALNGYDIGVATKAVEDFFEVLNNWYIRRSRERFWRTKIDDNKIAAYNTLFTILDAMCKAISPMLPYLAEEIFMGLHPELADHESVHLQQFPDLNIEGETDSIERVRDACNTALSIRNELGIRIRQPLRNVTFIGVAAGEAFDEEMKQLVLDEVNAKEWKNLPENLITQYANYKLQPIFTEIGKRIPEKVKDIIKANKEGDWLITDGRVIITGIELLENEFKLHLEVRPEFRNRAASLSSNDGLVLLDTEIDQELLDEGIARDVVRVIQQRRKYLNLNITDRISLCVKSEERMIELAIQKWSHYICEQTFAIICEEHVGELYKVEDINATISINKLDI